MKKGFILVTVLALLVMLAAGCAPGGAPAPTPPAPTPTPSPEEIAPPPAPEPEEVTPAPEPTPTVEWGIIEIRVTDPPPAEVASANVTLNKIEVHRVGGGWVTLIETPEPFDLLDVVLVPAVLGKATVETGNYTQIRMDVIEVVGETTEGVPYTANVTSGKLKLVGTFEVKAGITTILTLDFIGEKCLIRRGDGTFLFKPVVELTIEYRE